MTDLTDTILEQVENKSPEQSSELNTESQKTVSKIENGNIEKNEDGTIDILKKDHPKRKYKKSKKFFENQKKQKKYRDLGKQTLEEKTEIKEDKEDKEETNFFLMKNAQSLTTTLMENSTLLFGAFAIGSYFIYLKYYIPKWKNTTTEIKVVKNKEKSKVSFNRTSHHSQLLDNQEMNVNEVSNIDF
jgi:hypothetical protein